MKISDNNYKKLKIALAVIIALAVRMITIGTFGIRYQTNDDATLSNIAAGGYGSDTLHMVYVNVLFSALLRPLYAIFQTNWYVIVQLVLVVISIAVIAYLLMKKLGLIAGCAITLTMMTAFAEHIFYTFQYTECSFIMLSAGLLLIVDNLDKINKKTFAGILLALMGSMVRWTSFYAVGGLSAALLLYRFFIIDTEGKKKAVMTMIMLFAVIFGAKFYDVMSYMMDPAWNEYSQYNAARTAYSDFKYYRLGEENPFYDKGVTGIDYIMLNSWDFYDEEKFTTELLEELSEGKQEISFSQLIADSFEHIKDMMHGETYRCMFFAVALLAVLALRPKTGTAALVGMYMIYGLLMVYLTYNLRFTSWVEMGMAWTVSVFALYCIGEIAPGKKFTLAGIAVAMVFIFYISIPVYQQLYIDYPNYVEWTKLEQSYFEDMSRDKDNIYLLSTQAINVAAGFDVMNPRTDNFYSNIVAYGGWLSRAPHRERALANYGLNRPLVDAVDNPHVYLDYHNIENVVCYVKQELGVEIYAVKTGSNDFAPYQLVTTAPQE